MRLTGVYDANGSLSGELAYWVGARLGRRHCALCEITHGLLRAKADWLSLQSRLPVEFTAVHLDEREPVVADASHGRAPCVVAVFDDGSAEVVVDRDELEACEGNAESFFRVLLKVLGS
ncbi:MAG: hypothetical protein WD181_05160 [Solirubrobacterales bacterium]